MCAASVRCSDCDKSNNNVLPKAIWKTDHALPAKNHDNSFTHNGRPNCINATTTVKQASARNATPFRRYTSIQ